MPASPMKPCRHPGCKRLAKESYCDEHKRDQERRYAERRSNSGQRGYDARWQKVRAIKAANDPLCEQHLKQGAIVPLDVVHHIKPVETHPELRLVLDNLMSLCTACHEAIHKAERWGKK